MSDTLGKLLDYFDGRLEEEKDSKDENIQVSKGKLFDLTVEVRTRIAVDSLRVNFAGPRGRDK